MKNILLISDPNSDVDDLLSFAIASVLINKNIINICGVIATAGNFETRKRRAKMTKGAFLLLNQPFVDVAIGDDYLEENYHPANFFAENKYLLEIEKNGHIPNKTAQELFENIINQSKNKELIIVINAQMSDVYKGLICTNKNNLKKIDKIIIMGDVDNINDENGYLKPNPQSYNNKCSMSAAQNLYAFLQDNQIYTVFVNKECAYKTNVGKDFFDMIKSSKHPIANAIVYGHKKGLENLYNDTINGNYPHFDIKRFSSVFIGDENAILEHESFDKVWPKLNKFNLYDVVALLAAIDKEFDSFACVEKIANDKKMYKAIIKKPETFRKLLIKLINEILN